MHVKFFFDVIVLEFFIFTTKQGLRRAGGAGRLREARQGAASCSTGRCPGTARRTTRAEVRAGMKAEVKAVRCLCPDGSTQPATCPRGELVTDPTIPYHKNEVEYCVY